MVRRPSLLIAFGLLAACAAEPISAIQLPEAYEIAFCRRFEACQVFPTQSFCRQRASFFVDHYMSVSAGRIDFDGDAARACVDDLSALGCDDVAPLVVLDSCRTMFTPLVANGDVCEISADCIGGFCGPTPGGERCQPDPTVTFPVGVGEACGGNFVCAEGAYCHDGTCRARGRRGDGCSTSYALSSCLSWLDVCGPAGTCVARGQTGAACAAVTDPSVTFALDDCVLDNFCNPQGVCETDQFVGEVCPVGNECAVSLVCDSGICDIPGL